MDKVEQPLHQRQSSVLKSQIFASVPLTIPSDPIASIEDKFEEKDEGEGSLSCSARNSSGPDEAIFDDILHNTRESSPHTSNQSEDDISEFPADSRVPSYALDPRSSSPYTPHKPQPAFRNPSSVRAIQLNTTPPSYLTSPSSQRYKLSTPSRNSTSRSARSYHSAIRSSSKISPKKIRKEIRLILLHVTILPIASPYSQKVLEAVLPEYIIGNWKLLREKVTDTVIERGILIAHPQEEFDVLEERLLESLELKIPRILKCGHFHGHINEEDDLTDEYDSDEDSDMCDDCGRRVRDGAYGSGTGYRRWDMKIYASNGLMGAGAWSAAWKQMERIDVEILPWIDDSLRKELDNKREEEAANLHPLAPEVDLPSHEKPNMDEGRLREIYGESAQVYVDVLEEEPKASPQRPSPVHQTVPQQEVPILILLQNYIHLLLQDRRNVAILVLSMVVLLLSLGSRPATSAVANPIHYSPVPSMSFIEQDLQPRMNEVVSIVTNTAPASGIDSVAPISTLVETVTMRCGDESKEEKGRDFPDEQREQAIVEVKMGRDLQGGEHIERATVGAIQQVEE